MLSHICASCSSRRKLLTCQVSVSLISVPQPDNAAWQCSSCNRQAAATHKLCGDFLCATAIGSVASGNAEASAAVTTKHSSQDRCRLQLCCKRLCIKCSRSDHRLAACTSSLCQAWYWQRMCSALTCTVRILHCISAMAHPAQHLTLHSLCKSERQRLPSLCPLT